MLKYTEFHNEESLFKIQTSNRGEETLFAIFLKYNIEFFLKLNLSIYIRETPSWRFKP